MKIRQRKHVSRYVLTYRGTGWGAVRYTRKRCEYPAKPADLKAVGYFNKVDERIEQGYSWMEVVDELLEEFER